MCRSHTSWLPSSVFLVHSFFIWACWDMNGKRPHVAVYCLCVVKLCFSELLCAFYFHYISSMREAVFYCRFPNWSLRVPCLETYILPRDHTLRQEWLVHSWEPLYQWDSSRNLQHNPPFFFGGFFIFIIYLPLSEIFQQSQHISAIIIKSTSCFSSKTLTL